MPAISLVICVYREHDLLKRLLENADACYDDLIVVHDGPEEGGQADGAAEVAAIDYAERMPDRLLPSGYRQLLDAPLPGTIHALVHQYGGRFFEGPRCFQQEPHWPFTWSQAREEWVLRLDADEFPSAGLRSWLRAFRAQTELPTASGYTCIWPLWDGLRAVTQGWPGGRLFLFDRRRVRFFGMVEQTPIPDGTPDELRLVLCHQPTRKSYGVRNILVRRQAYHWRRVIAQSLLGKATDLPRWRWSSEAWPDQWERLRLHPLRHSLTTLVRYPLHQVRGMLRAGQRPILSACLNPGLHHFMLGLRVFAEQRRRRRHLPS